MRPIDAIETLHTYSVGETKRMMDVGNVLVEGSFIVSDLGVCYRKLIEARRPDLVIHEPAQMMEVAHPLEVLEKCNNFTPNFQVATSVVKHEVASSIPELPPHSEYTRIPITKAELDDLRLGRAEIDDPGGSHVQIPAYRRMLALLPEFTTKLTLAFSEHGYDALDQRFRPELFVAYQIMSRLVDKNDEDVMQDGEVDTWYLCR